MFVFKAAVVGAGTMGGEIAFVIASADLPVVLVDIDRDALNRGVDKARSLWQAQVQAGKLDAAEAERRLGLIAAATDYAQLGDVDFVIEAVPERMEIKQGVFAELDAATPSSAILATNTSSLSITEIGEATTRPDQVVGFHFGFPASESRMLEVIEGEDTSAQTAQSAVNFAQTLRKLPTRSADAPGFVINRILNAAASELWRAHEESGLDAQAFDALISESPNSGPYGPFLVADFLGIDTVVHVAEHLRESHGDRFYVHRGMQALVAEGHVGVKSGKGFYEHGG